ncbi:hypothetical protein AX14_004153 [Amanita brunnescens Koide BX004]|nr:hypothetical protein AX14_004153 [Amanita brunnescens Koide BX004]
MKEWPIGFSPDGTHIVSGSEDYTIRVWDARSGDVVAGPFQGHTDYVGSVAFSLDGTCIVSGSDDSTIRVWDTRSGDIVAGPFRDTVTQITSGRLRSLRMAPASSLVQTMSQSEYGTCTMRTLLLVRFRVRSVASFPDVNSNLSDEVLSNQKTAKPRTRSAKYLLRQGPYIENWNSPGCELSELYGQKRSPSINPSPLLSAFLADPLPPRQDVGEQMFRCLGRSPTLPAGMSCSCTASSSRILRSPFLSSTSDLDKLKSSPILADFSDLTQLVMKDLQPVAYSNNPSSAVTACTFWDIPVNLTPLRASDRLERSSGVFCVDDMLSIVDNMSSLSPPCLAVNTFLAATTERTQEGIMYNADSNRRSLGIRAITQADGFTSIWM